MLLTLMFLRDLRRFLLCAFNLSIVLSVTLWAGDYSNIALFQQMVPQHLNNCAALLRPALSNSNVTEFLSGDGNIRFVVAVNQDRQPILILLGENELHLSFAETRFTSADPSMDIVDIIHGNLHPDFNGGAIQGFSVVLGGTIRRNYQDPVLKTAIVELLRSQIQIPNAYYAFDRVRVGSENNATSSSSELYSPGWAIGRLKFVVAENIERELQSGELTPSHILVTDDVPPDLAPFAGIISSTPAAELGHIGLLSAALQTPFAHIPSKDLEPSRKFENQMVLLRAFKGAGDRLDWRIIPVQNLNFEPLLALKQRRSLALPPLDLKYSEVTSLKGLNREDSTRVGSKAAGLGFLTKLLGPQYVPTGVAIPFYYFSEFLRRVRIGEKNLFEEIQTTLAPLLDPHQPERTFLQTEMILAKIRFMIQTATFPQDLLREICDDLRTKLPREGRGYLWRSSSNLEDSDSFNGAGLYSSATSLDLNEAAAETAIKQVGSSLYDWRPFYVRRLFHVDETNVGMAMIVHPQHEPAQFANGVSSITYVPGKGRAYRWESRHNPYGDAYKVTHTALRGRQILATNPLPGIVPERLSMSLDTENGFPIGNDQRIYDQGGKQPLFLVSVLHDLNEFLAHIMGEWIGLASGYQYAADPGGKFPSTRSINVEWYIVEGPAPGTPDRLIIRQVREQPVATELNAEGIDQALERLSANPNR